ncbi:MAG: nicotinate-nucleotide adenylyltransferase [Saprospirales bacterium]|nr:MAG: nicotinate-nucleotide adenylyltransferase [Saprospirales bacterium]
MAKKTGLFFGSFNPIHIGHLIIANFMVTKTDLEEIWLVVSPHNPFKKKSSLAPERDRQHLVELAVNDNALLRCSDIEFYLPQPSYTIDTLVHLREKFPTKSFSLIMGADNLRHIHKWKNAEILVENYEIYLYNRPGYDVEMLQLPPKKLRVFESPQIAISSTYIRECLKNGHSARYLLPEPVYNYLLEHNLYK